MFLVKIVMFLKRSWLPGYQLLDVEDLGGIHQSSSWNAEGYQCTLCLCEGKLSNRPGAVEGGHPLLCSSEDDSLSAGKGRGGGDEKAGDRESCLGLHSRPRFHRGCQPPSVCLWEVLGLKVVYVNWHQIRVWVLLVFFFSLVTQHVGS